MSVSASEKNSTKKVKVSWRRNRANSLFGGGRPVAIASPQAPAGAVARRQNGYSFFLSPVEHMSGGDRAADRRDFVGFPASREVANDTSFVGETPSGMSDGSVFAAVICAGRRSFAR